MRRVGWLVLTLGCGPRSAPHCEPALADCAEAEASRDGEVVWKLTQTAYNACGQMEHYVSGPPTESPGQTTDVRHYHYDDDDRLLRMDRDRNDDGVLDMVEHYATDAARRLVRIDRDDLADGSIDTTVTFTHSHGLHGRTTLMSVAGGDTTTYEFDVLGRLLRLETVDSEGVLQHLRVGTWSGPEVVYEVDLDGDGSVDEFWHETWEGDRQLVSFRETADGEPVGRIAYTYDEDGRRLTSTNDHGDDGSIDSRTDHTWVCP